ncbi:MAG: RraA family protein [Erythrobacter sp.]|uniref:RraA family protein n=1 Tax=Erythrobacter sp. TaxID=1042 RepID=UPI0026051921|nr:RraA family protein [Erythrobacter sp.]MDJ0978152.1 RraA family protein [Erythrobacter sp.]
MSDTLVERAAAIDTATLSDALDKLGIAGQCLGIKPLDPKFRLAGRAFTLRYVPVGGEPGTVGDYIDDVAPGSVCVLDNAGREDATVWGDILTFVANKRGIAGTVIDGACRDTALAREIGYPLYSRSYSMRTGKDRVQLDAAQVPVMIGGAEIAPGDILIGDTDGVIAIPQAREEEVVTLAETIFAAEERIREAVAGGKRLDQARKDEAYHLLQRRDA